jgi:hypothetical protein
MALELIAPPDGRPGRILARALALWPGLDRRALLRTHGDPARIARLVMRRSALPEESIIAMLDPAR